MRRISVANLDGTASVVGMGCASLGSRVGRREGLRALNRAFDAGVTGLTWRHPTAMQKLRRSSANSREASETKC